MEQDRSIPTGATASLIAHLSVLALLVLLSEVHPLGSATEPIAVNIVTTEEAEPEKAKPVQPPDETPPIALPDPSASASPVAKTPAPAAPQPASSATRSVASSAGRPDQRQAAAPPPPAQAGSASAAYRSPEPDLSVKYNVMLGLPPELPPQALAPHKAEEGFDVTTSNADISSSVIAQFRQHLKTCSKLPASVQPSDHIMVKLRVMMTSDGRLAGDPVVGGGSAHPKAIELLQGAIAGLKQCQPYTMLPADRYGEWKVLDLDFTPKDFSG